MKIERENNGVVLHLPLTQPTGSVRVKRPVPDAPSEPVATRSAPLSADDYLEWQINYDTESPDDPTAVHEVKLERDGRTKLGSELTRMLFDCRALGLVSNAELESLIKAGYEAEKHLLDRAERLTLTPAPRQPPSNTELLGWQRGLIQAPTFLKRGDKHAVEITLARKQRAVGVQAMVFVWLPLRHCTPLDRRPAFAGRTARRNEQAGYRLDLTNKALLIDTVTAFLFAADDTRRDVMEILRKLRQL